MATILCNLSIFCRTLTVDERHYSSYVKFVIAYEWDETKATKNLAKHGVDFAAAADFDWVTAVVEIDDRRDYGEIRYLGIGFIGPRLHMMAFTNRSLTVRIISLRKANNLEVRKYEKEKRSS